MSNEEHILTTCRLVDFQDARIEEISRDFTPYLIVSGLKPYANMHVDLLARMYIERPEYWAIEVVGCTDRIALPAVTPYEAILALDFPVGTKGIRIIGAGSAMKEIDFQYSKRPNPDDGGKASMSGPPQPR